MTKLTKYLIANGSVTSSNKRKIKSSFFVKFYNWLYNALGK